MKGRYLYDDQLSQRRITFIRKSGAAAAENHFGLDWIAASAEAGATVRDDGENTSLRVNYRYVEPPIRRQKKISAADKHIDAEISCTGASAKRILVYIDHADSIDIRPERRYSEGSFARWG